MPAEERQSLRAWALESRWRTALDVLGRESKIIQIASRDLRDGKPLDRESLDRVAVACARIDDAREVLR
jgi:hypothetical protein